MPSAARELTYDDWDLIIEALAFFAAKGYGNLRHCFELAAQIERGLPTKHHTALDAMR